MKVTPRIGLNSIGRDKYFIRLKDKQEYFMHLTDAKRFVFRFKKGPVGAIVVNEEKAHELIEFIRRTTGATNVEKVLTTQVLPNDGTMN